MHRRNRITVKRTKSMCSVNRTPVYKCLEPIKEPAKVLHLTRIIDTRATRDAAHSFRLKRPNLPACVRYNKYPSLARICFYQISTISLSTSPVRRPRAAQMANIFTSD